MGPFVGGGLFAFRNVVLCRHTLSATHQPVFTLIVHGSCSSGNRGRPFSLAEADFPTSSTNLSIMSQSRWYQLWPPPLAGYITL